MILYRIRRKDNGKFFCGLGYPWHKSGKEKWNDKGTFFREIDTITAWLKVLCADWKAHRETMKWGTAYSSKRLAEIVNDTYDKTHLNRYEVVVTNVTINGHKIIQAKDLVK